MAMPLCPIWYPRGGPSFISNTLPPFPPTSPSCRPFFLTINRPPPSPFPPQPPHPLHNLLTSSLFLPLSTRFYSSHPSLTDFLSCTSFPFVATLTQHSPGRLSPLIIVLLKNPSTITAFRINLLTFGFHLQSSTYLHPQTSLLHSFRHPNC